MSFRAISGEMRRETVRVVPDVTVGAMTGGSP
jgi:hypothetical protein